MVSISVSVVLSPAYFDCMYLLPASALHGRSFVHLMRFNRPPSLSYGRWDFWISSKWWFDFSWLHKLSVRIICSSGFDIFPNVFPPTGFMCMRIRLWLFTAFQFRIKTVFQESKRCRLCFKCEKTSTIDVYHPNTTQKKNKKTAAAAAAAPTNIQREC